MDLVDVGRSRDSTQPSQVARQGEGKRQGRGKGRQNAREGEASTEVDSAYPAKAKVHRRNGSGQLLCTDIDKTCAQQQSGDCLCQEQKDCHHVIDCFVGQTHKITMPARQSIIEGTACRTTSLIFQDTEASVCFRVCFVSTVCSNTYLSVLFALCVLTCESVLCAVF